MKYWQDTAMCVQYRHEGMGEWCWYAIGDPEQVARLQEDTSIEILGVVLCEWTEEMQDYAKTIKKEYLGYYIAEIFHENLLSTNS